MSIFRPSNFSEGGGLLNDANVTVKDASIVLWDYQGKGPLTPAIKFVFAVEGEDNTVEQYWSVGKATDWQPSEDGKKLVPIGKATQIVQSSNGGILLASIVNAGFPEDKITDDITCFVGMKGHVIRVPAPQRSGIAKAPRADGKSFEDTILTFDKITSFPGEKKAGKTGKGVATAKANEEDAGDVESEAVGVMLSILAENPEGILKSKLPAIAFKAAGNSPNKTQIVQLLYKDDFLSSRGEWTYADGKITLA
jgi:hypothetical protein